MIESKYFNSGLLSKYPFIKTESDFERFANYADQLPLPEWPEGTARNVPDFEATLKCLVTSEVFQWLREKYEKYDMPGLGITGNILKKSDSYFLAIEQLGEYLDFADADDNTVNYDLESELMNLYQQVLQGDMAADDELQTLLKKYKLRERPLFLLVVSKTNEQIPNPQNAFFSETDKI